MMKQAQAAPHDDGAVAAWVLWVLVVFSALVALAAFGVWHGLHALEAMGGLRVEIDGRDVLRDFPWQQWSGEERFGFSLLLGMIFLMVLIIVPLAVAAVLVVSLAVSALALLMAAAPFVLPVLLIVWLVRRARRPGPQ
jgi:hypothetical protein